MANVKIKTSDNNEEVVNDLSVHVMDAITKRGFKPAEYDEVDAIYLWKGNYRINAYKDHKIKESYFIKFNKEEGILRMWPNLEE